MGAPPSKVQQDVEALPKLQPEPDYEIKTRSPMPKNWTLNIMRGKREDELRVQSYPIVRRKCYDYVKALERCEVEQGKFWTPFNCQEENQLMGICFDHELAVEMDKRRRDMSRHPEWWWRELYDENGEIMDQKEWDGSWFLTLKAKELLGMAANRSNANQQASSA